MNDTTVVAFGKLMMPMESFSTVTPSPQVWGEIAFNGWILVASLFFILLNIKKLYRLFPNLWAGVFRHISNVMIEDRVELVNTRNQLSIPFIVALCPIVDRFLMPQSNISSVFIICAAYWLYKFVLSKRFSANRVDLNFIIIMVSTLLLLWPILGLCQASEADGRKIVLIVMFAFFIFQLIREFQFFRSKYPAFRTFLYLCALEILPLGILILIWPQ